MKHKKGTIAAILKSIDLGSGIAESDGLLEEARVETSVTSDLLGDRVDLIPGTKGSGKSALYRIFVEFLPEQLLTQHKVVLAHGVQSHGEPVFQVFKDEFEKLSEDDFVNFWCVYLVSLAHEHFIKEERYRELLSKCSQEIRTFRRSCHAAKIPEIKARLSLRDVLEWCLNAIPRPRKMSYNFPDGTSVSVDLFGNSREDQTNDENAKPALPRYIHQVKENLEAILESSGLHLWFLIDRLDEIFPRRSEVETLALRGLLRTLRIFESKSIRVKIFLRDDILEQITTKTGFTAISHITARAADKLTWSEDQILAVVVRRCFTPRDVIYLLNRARQHQHDEFDADSDGQSDFVIGSKALQYGLSELSKWKRDTYLKAEFPHFWSDIQKLEKGKSEYSEKAMKKLLGKEAKRVIDNLVGIGLLEATSRHSDPYFKIPFVYRSGLDLTQGRVE